MARFTFKLPDIGEGISEAEIVAWHIAVGDRVEEDQQVADMMTDKATVVMESPVSGVIVQLAGEVGDQVAIGAALVVIETDAVEAEGEVRAAPPTPEQVETAEQYEAENPGVGEAVTPALKVEAPTLAAAPQMNASQPDGAATAKHGEPDTRAPHALASPAVRARATSASTLIRSRRNRDMSATPTSTRSSAMETPKDTARAKSVTRVPTSRSRSSAYAGASPRTWPHRSAQSRTSPMSKRLT